MGGYGCSTKQYFPDFLGGLVPPLGQGKGSKSSLVSPPCSLVLSLQSVFSFLLSCLSCL